jgi:hypothetical protein
MSRGERRAEKIVEAAARGLLPIGLFSGAQFAAAHRASDSGSELAGTRRLLGFIADKEVADAEGSSHGQR